MTCAGRERGYARLRIRKGERVKNFNFFAYVINELPVTKKDL